MTDHPTAPDAVRVWHALTAAEVSNVLAAHAQTGLSNQQVVERQARNGKYLVVAAEELVPGDLIELEAGDHLPADARLVESFAFGVQESALTGESVPIHKDAAALPETTALADRRNMVYLGTIAVAGRAMALVVATGMQTELEADDRTPRLIVPPPTFEVALPQNMQSIGISSPLHFPRIQIEMFVN